MLAFEAVIAADASLLKGDHDDRKIGPVAKEIKFCIKLVITADAIAFIKTMPLLKKACVDEHTGRELCHTPPTAYQGIRLVKRSIWFASVDGIAVEETP